MKYLLWIPFFLSLTLLTRAQTNTTAKSKALLYVLVTDFKGKPRPNEEIVFYGTTTQQTVKGISNQSGQFTAELPLGDTYKILISALGEQTEYSTIKVGKEEGMYRAEVTIKFEMPTTVTLKNVLFKSGSAELAASSFKSLDELVAFMNRKTTLVIEIAGHTDNVGSVESNQLLSQKRADAVRSYILSKGISTTRVLAKGYGQNEPVADNSTEQGRSTNRRTEVRIIKE